MQVMKKLLLPLLALLCLLFPLAAQADGLTLYLDGEAVSGACVVDIAARPSFQMTAS